MKLHCILIFIIVGANAAPAPTIKPTTPPPEEEQIPEHEDVKDAEPANTGLYYDKYLQKVVQLLESDEGFRKAMESASFDDIKSGKMSTELLNIPSNIRDELDALKREEMLRLRRIAHAKSEVDKGRRISQPTHIREIAQHLDPDNDHTFEAKDLTNLIQAATRDLENYDEKRHEEFKRYEMNKELRRQEKLRQMSEEDRKRAEEEYKESRKRHEEHASMNHPGSKAQMEEVWEEEDGLKGQEFNPKTFFNMHDLNSDGYLDQMELEALFEKDLRKVYDESNPDDDMEEMRAERMRMREHVMKEVDTDRDGLISMKEFLEYSKTQSFEKPDESSYKTVDEMIDNNDLFSDEEYEEFKNYIREQEEDLKAKLSTLRDKARSVAGKKTDLNSNVKNLKEQNIQVENHPGIDQQKQDIKVEEEEMKQMHEELRKQSKELMELKKEVQKQEQLKNPTEAPPTTAKIPVDELHRQYQEKMAQEAAERSRQDLDPAAQQQAQLNAQQQQQQQQAQLNAQQQQQAQYNAQQQQAQLDAQQQAQLNAQQQQQAQLNAQQQQQQAQYNAQQQQAQLDAQQQAQLNAQQQQQAQYNAQQQQAQLDAQQQAQLNAQQQAQFNAQQQQQPQH